MVFQYYVILPIQYMVFGIVQVDLNKSTYVFVNFVVKIINIVPRSKIIKVIYYVIRSALKGIEGGIGPKKNNIKSMDKSSYEYNRLYVSFNFILYKSN